MVTHRPLTSKEIKDVLRDFSQTLMEGLDNSNSVVHTLEFLNTVQIRFTKSLISGHVVKTIAKSQKVSKLLRNIYRSLWL